MLIYHKMRSLVFIYKCVDFVHSKHQQLLYYLCTDIMECITGITNQH